MEVVDCLLCGQSERRVRYYGRDRLHPIPGEFTLVECDNCGFLYLSPRPDSSEIGRYYPPEYGAYHTDEMETYSPFVSRIRQYDLEIRCATVLRYRSGGDLLDYGCGSGDFLAAMKKHAGWRVRGLEPYARGVAERARERYGVAVDEVDPENVRLSDGSFDVVTMWEVLEHVPQPLDTLHRVHRLLRPGGLLVLSVPNRRSFLAYLAGSSWIGLDVPRHLSVFAPSDMERAMAAAGFSTPRIFSERGRLGAANTELVCVLLSIRALFHGEIAPGWIRRRAALMFDRWAANPRVLVMSFLLTLPYSNLARVVNRGSQMVVVARRD